MLARAGIHSIRRGSIGQRKVRLDVRNPTRLWNEAMLLADNFLNLSIRCHDRLPVYREYRSAFGDLPAANRAPA